MLFAYCCKHILYDCKIWQIPSQLPSCMAAFIDIAEKGSGNTSIERKQHFSWNKNIIEVQEELAFSKLVLSGEY